MESAGINSTLKGRSLIILRPECVQHHSNNGLSSPCPSVETKQFDYLWTCPPSTGRAGGRVSALDRDPNRFERAGWHFPSMLFSIRFPLLRIHYDGWWLYGFRARPRNNAQWFLWWDRTPRFCFGLRGVFFGNDQVHPSPAALPVTHTGQRRFFAGGDREIFFKLDFPWCGDRPPLIRGRFSLCVLGLLLCCCCCCCCLPSVRRCLAWWLASTPDPQRRAPNHDDPTMIRAPAGVILERTAAAYHQLHASLETCVSFATMALYACWDPRRGRRGQAAIFGQPVKLRRAKTLPEKTSDGIMLGVNKNLRLIHAFPDEILCCEGCVCVCVWVFVGLFCFFAWTIHDLCWCFFLCVLCLLQYKTRRSGHLNWFFSSLARPGKCVVYRDSIWNELKRGEIAAGVGWKIVSGNENVHRAI